MKLDARPVLVLREEIFNLRSETVIAMATLSTYLGRVSPETMDEIIGGPNEICGCRNPRRRLCNLDGSRAGPWCPRKTP